MSNDLTQGKYAVLNTSLVPKDQSILCILWYNYNYVPAVMKARIDKKIGLSLAWFISSVNRCIRLIGGNNKTIIFHHNRGLTIIIMVREVKTRVDIT